MSELKTTGRGSFMLGRKKPLVVGPHLRMSRYMTRKMPSPPASCSYLPSDMSWLENILGNDANGDCTCAAAFHIGGMMLQNANQPLPPAYNAQTCLNFYYHLTGGQDTGLDEQTVFNFWQKHGLLSNGTHEITARVIVDPTDKTEVQAALWLFENLYLTAGLPDAWVNNEPEGNGFTWDVAGPSDPDNGHAFCGVAYDGNGVQIDTWGLIGTLTYAALAEYNDPSNGGGCYAVISKDSINTASMKAPNGFNFAQLQSDIASFQS
jgi:hypothetical protein